jgi:uncharacterized protein (UPF0264 family)
MQDVEGILLRNRPGLLVSVRSADEALDALAGGADVIDIKEPLRGPLGAADRQTIADVVRAVDGRAPVTAAAGELVDLLPQVDANSIEPMAPGVSLVKIGLAHCGGMCDWQGYWRRASAALTGGDGTSHALTVAVSYADWHAAAAPAPASIHSAALEFRCRVVLIDTWDKSTGSLFDHWPYDELRSFVERVRASGLAIVLAGSLSGSNLLAATDLRPQLVAVRGAACDDGRDSTVSQFQIAGLRQSMNQTTAERFRHDGDYAFANNKLLRHREFS